MCGLFFFFFFGVLCMCVFYRRKLKPLERVSESSWGISLNIICQNYRGEQVGLWHNFLVGKALIFLICLIMHLLYEVDIAAHMHLYLCTCECFFVRDEKQYIKSCLVLLFPMKLKDAYSLEGKL